MASASCHVKNPCKKRKMRHERVLRPIARNRVVHQGTEASNRVKRRRGGMLARKHVMQCHGGYELLRTSVAQSGSTALAVSDAVGVQPLEHDPRGCVPRLALGHEAVAQAARMARAVANGLHILKSVVNLPPFRLVPALNAKELKGEQRPERHHFQQHPYRHGIPVVVDQRPRVLVRLGTRYEIASQPLTEAAR